MGLPAFAEVVDWNLLEDQEPESEDAAIQDAVDAIAEVWISLQRQERKLNAFQQRLATFQASVAGFLSMAEARLAALSESDLNQALDEMLGVEASLEEVIAPRLETLRGQRQEAVKRGRSNMNSHFIELLDREETTLRTVLKTCKTGRESMLRLKDRLLVLEAQQMTAQAFWDDDDE